MRTEGAVIEAIREGSPAERAGLRASDMILSINGLKVNDLIDYLFMRCEPTLDMEIKRGERRLSVSVTHSEEEDPGIELKDFKIKICKNNCIFCFVSQLPKGLRKTLYVKDEDYRMSFLYGNYITMTNLTEKDKERIITQRLSPLYISVHSTERALRNKILGNPSAEDIMKELNFLKEHRISMHVQIVLCPGVNDGEHLKRTILDLHSLYPYLLSVAVVPVGLTSHRKLKLRAVEKEDAQRAISLIEGFQRRFRKRHGDPIVYAADELYIKAEMPFPPLKDYGELPQIENGVGMVPLFLSEARKIKISQGVVQAGGRAISPKKRYITFTGVSFFPFLKRFIERLYSGGLTLSAVPVVNTFFGQSVTVTGLLTGRDILKALIERSKGFDVLLVPDIVLREAKDLMLDDLRAEDIGSALGLRTRVIESTPKGLIEGIIEEEKGG